MHVEEQLGGPSAPEFSTKPVPIRSRVFRLLAEEVSPKLSYLPLLACCFGSGLTDSTLYNAYGTFVSMQTGNTIFVALGASGQNNKPYGWARSLCSIGCFVGGSLFFSRLHALAGARRRATLVLSFLLQGGLVCVAAGLIQGGVINGRYYTNSSADRPTPLQMVVWAELAPVAMLSFQAAGQIVASRALGVGEVPTVVITSLLCDLVSDLQLLAPLTQNKKRNSRVVAFVLTLVGGIAGGWISKATGVVQPALWVVAGIKLVIGVCWIFWKAKA